MELVESFLIVTGITTAALLLGAGVLQFIALLGRPGRAVIDVLCRAPWIDAIMTYFVAVPMILGAVYEGWVGLAGAVAGQFAGLLIWIALHELAHPAARKGPRIYQALDRITGAWRNHTAMWVTIFGVPIIWLVRVDQLLFYPILVRLLGFPKYQQCDWVNLSRHKFEGLVGYDLVWCLYCDWMTGVWSLGTEMLRNVESFWCPIRFASGKKCENCKIDFPDVVQGWVPAEGDMAQVAQKIEAMHGQDKRSWFGHPERVGLDVLVPAPAACAHANGHSNGNGHTNGNGHGDVESLAAAARALLPEDRAKLAAMLQDVP